MEFGKAFVWNDVGLRRRLRDHPVRFHKPA
jgi:hypothetical protein